MSCEQCCGIASEFNDRIAQRVLRRFRRRGPDRTTRILIDELRRTAASSGGGGLSLLDIGAGVGAIHHDLLDGVVERATHVDAAPAQLRAAREETRRRGHEGAVKFLEADFTSIADQVPAADIVTLDRVICCFDDMERLVRLSAGKARRWYGAVYPRRVGWMRLALGAINLVQRMKRSPFRVFLHDPRAIDSMLRSSGLRPRSARQTAGWHAVVYERGV
jgi:magnesium-protoporphyrin O-methyltransferase